MARVNPRKRIAQSNTRSNVRISSLGRQLLRQLSRFRNSTSNSRFAKLLYRVYVAFVQVFRKALPSLLKRWRLFQKLFWLRKFKGVRKWISSSSTSEKLYYFGSFLAFLTALTSLGIMLQIDLPTTTLFSIYGSLACYSAAFTLDITKFVAIYRKNPIFRAFLALTGVITAGISLIASRILINSITRVEPSHFPVAVSLFTSILTPVMWWILAVFILLLFYVVLLLALMINFFIFSVSILFLSVYNHSIFRFFFQNKKITEERISLLQVEGVRWLIFNAFGVASLIVVLVAFSGTALVHCQDQIPKLVTTITVYSSYQPVSGECENRSKNEWIAPIGNNKISVAIPDKVRGFTFDVRSCN